MLNFIAQLEVSELPQFFAALMKPLICMPAEDPDDASWFWGYLNSPFADNPAIPFFKYFTREHLMGLSWKKKSGFLHVTKDIIEVFDETRIRPFLELLMGCIVRLLDWCTENINNAKSSEFASVDRSIVNHSKAKINQSGANQTKVSSWSLPCRI